MPANMWDHSNLLLANQTGAILAQGLDRLGQGISRGIEDYRRKKKEKEAEAAAISWLQKNGQAMGLDATDEGELKAAVKAAGGGMQAIQLISALETQQQQRSAARQQQALAAEQLAAAQQQRQQRLRSSGAAALAAGGTPGRDETGALIQGGASFRDLEPGGAAASPDEVVAGYLSRSGDIAGAGGLAEAYGRLEALKQKDRGPYVADFGNGLRGVVANGNFIVDPRLRQEPEKPATREVSVGGKKMTVGPGDKYFDEEGKPVQFTAGRAPSPPPFELKATDPELYEAMRDEYMAYSQQRRGGQPPPAGKQPAAEVKDDQFTSPEAVREALRGGKISRDRAERILKGKYGFK